MTNIEFLTTKPQNTKIKVPHLTRLVQLRRAGLSNSATAKVLNLDLGTHLNAESVRKYTKRLAPELVSESHRNRKGAFGEAKP